MRIMVVSDNKKWTPSLSVPILFQNQNIIEKVPIMD